MSSNANAGADFVQTITFTTELKKRTDVCTGVLPQAVSTYLARFQSTIAKATEEIMEDLVDEHHPWKRNTTENVFKGSNRLHELSFGME
jgi:hypothetical protein